MNYVLEAFISMLKFILHQEIRNRELGLDICFFIWMYQLWKVSFMLLSNKINEFLAEKLHYKVIKNILSY